MCDTEDETFKIEVEELNINNNSSLPRPCFTDKKRILISRRDKLRYVIKRKSGQYRRYNMAAASPSCNHGDAREEDRSSRDNVGCDDFQHVEYDENSPPNRNSSSSTYSNSFFGFVGNMYTTMRTTIAPKAIDFMTTQVAPRALKVMKRVLQDIPGHQMFPDSDEDESGEWHDCRYEDSDDEDNGSDEYQDADEQISPRDRIHHICNELLTTEEAYVARLGILVMVKQKTIKILGDEVAKNMFTDIEVIHKFHQDNLLPQLQKRLQHWEEHRRVGDIMRKLTPFLKLYTEYVKNFQMSSGLVETWEERSNTFNKLLKEVREDKKYGRLRLQAHMLEPVQRVPRYELLLADYLKRLPDNADDREDTERALEQVSQAAKHFEEVMKRNSRMLELVQLQNSLDGAVNIVSVSRELVKKGKIMTISAKSSKSVERRAFLFNDLLLIADSGSSRLSVKFKVKHAIELPTAQVADGNNIDIPNTFYVKTKDTVVEICLRSEGEKNKWQDAIQKQLGECTKQKLIRHGSKLITGSQRPKPLLGKRAPVLVHQTGVTMCMVCGTAFTALKKKKHCRACGNVVCTKCSSHNFTLPYDETKAQRVCDECFVILEDKLLVSASSSNTGSPRVARKPRVQGECLQKGYLQLSSDGAKTWKKRWFAIHENLTVYSFRAPQDIHPLTSMALNGYKFLLDDSKRGVCIKLQGMGKTYLLHNEDLSVIQRWYETLVNLVKSVSIEDPSSPTSPEADKRDSSESDTVSMESLQLSSPPDYLNAKDKSETENTNAASAAQMDKTKR